MTVAMTSTQRKLSTILAADAAGYSRLMGDDDKATVRTLTDYRLVFTEHISRHQGHVVDTAGDSVLAVFESPVEAVECSMEIQKELTRRNRQLAEHRRMLFRIGLNLGDVITREDGTVYGDGVNIAARLQSIAEPGRICLSASVYDQVENHLQLTYADIGEQQVKNIAKPVRAYRVIINGTGSVLESSPARTSIMKHRTVGITLLVVILTALAVGAWWWHDAKPQGSVNTSSKAPMSDKPSIAVLPFANISDDRGQEYFSDGLTEDIITSLSHFRELFVIARNSTSAYKGQAVNVQEVGRKLAVRYVLEGSVRRMDDRVRITAQLVDATSGGHVWAHAYDEKLDKLFTIQDEVVRQIAGALGVSIRDAEKERALRKPTENLNAYELVLRAGQLWAEASPAEHLKLRTLMEQAVALDPSYARAQALLAFAYLDEYRWQYNPHLDRPEPLKNALERAQLAVRLDPSDAYTHYALGKIAYYAKELDLAEAEFGKSFTLNPSAADPRADWGIRLAVMGRPDEGVVLTREAMRFNPVYPSWYHFTYAADALNKGDFARAVAESENIGLRQLMWTQIFLCTSYAYAGRKDAAREAAKEILRLHPQIEKDWDRQTTDMHSWAPRFKEIVAQGLRKAGLFADVK